MIRKSICAAIVLAVFAAGAVDAQSTKGGKKLYRWVDAQGKVHYDDALPAEAVNQAQKVFNSKTGSQVAAVDRALTADERAQQAAALKAAEDAALKAGEQKRQEDIMMASYQTEADIRRAYDERIALLKMTLESTDVSIKSLRENLATMLSQASDTELEGRRVVEDRAKAIRELHEERNKQQMFQVNRRAELAALSDEFARMLARYRELRAAEAAPATPGAPAPTPPSGTP
jgi:hypothetical protein